MKYITFQKSNYGYYEIDWTRNAQALQIRLWNASSRFSTLVCTGKINNNNKFWNEKITFLSGKCTLSIVLN